MKLAPWMLRVVVAATACASAGACGEKFHAVKGQGSAGTNGVAGATNSGGDPGAGGVDAADGATGGAGGDAGGGEAGGAEAGKGGTSSGAAGGAGMGGVAGVGGLGGIGGGQAPVLPISDERLELWYSADTGAVTEDGFVSSWTDASGHDRHATQSAANYRPKLAAESLNGKLAVVFDGSDDSMDIPVMENDFSKGVSLFMVVRATKQDSCQGYFELSNGRELEDLHLGDYRGSLLYEAASPFLNDLMYPLLFDEPIIAVALHYPDGVAKARQNGNGVGELRDMPLPVTGQRRRNYLGLSLYDTCLPMKGAISELALFSRAVGDDELLKMEAHLRKKWACCAAE